MIYRGNRRAQISFPLGGIGSGCIGLAGNGALVDWEIFNRPAKGSRNGFSHFAVRAEKDGKVLDFRVLNGGLVPPYSGEFMDSKNGRSSFGFGPDSADLAGFPHFRECSFRGEYPFAQIRFGGEKFPAAVTLDAWSVFIPGSSRDSSLPAAFFEVTLENTAKTAIDFTVIGVLSNHWGPLNACRRNEWNGSRLTAFSGDGKGDLSLTLVDTDSQISGQESFFRGGWFDALEVYRADVLRGGEFKNRTYPVPESPCPETGLAAFHFTLKPGAKAVRRFILTWSVPERGWGEDVEKIAVEKGVPNRWRNYYATQWKDSRDSGDYALRGYACLREKTRRFHDALYRTTLPAEVLASVTANLAVLKSPTCLRLEDGTFYGWEGVGASWGSCVGSCTHVWNYAQALPFLFPDLERTLRESHLKYSIDENGGAHFRLSRPYGIHATAQNFRPCADGQFGDIMKFFRDWKVCGSADWLRKWYPSLKRMMEYTWSEKNPDRWDPDRSGILTGRQHNTLDIELFGPNAWLTGHYLGALLAMSEMAEAAGDPAFAGTCRALFRKGRKRASEDLFNGEYFIQKIDLKDRSILKKSGLDADAYWSEERGEIKYQIGDGCEIDSTLAQWYGLLYGIGEVFPAELVKKDLESVFRNNFKESMRDEWNCWRCFSLGGEGGVRMCTWPHGNTPDIPLCYNSETMTGFEWAFACRLVMSGMVSEAMKVIHALRARFDGFRRNPWNEFECGSNYARSMASFGLLAAFSGFEFDSGNGMLGFHFRLPRRTNNTFWTLGTAWGNYAETSRRGVLEVCSGSFRLKELRLGRIPEAVFLGKKELSFRRSEHGIVFEPVEVVPGAPLVLRWAR